MKGYLLDTNLLVALPWPSHKRHDLAARWFARHRARGWATCPLTEAGFVRIVGLVDPGSGERKALETLA